MRIFPPIAALLLGIATGCSNPRPVHLTRLSGWTVRPDDPTADVSKLTLTPMNPGWHVATGPVHAIFFKPEMAASGNFTTTLDTYFFGPPGSDPEGYGVIVGGRDLSGPSQAYVYFVVADNGTYLLKRRSGNRVSTVVDWTPSSAIRTVPAGDSGNVENVLSVHATPDSVEFAVNGTPVTTRPRSELVVDGVVGFRVNHSLSVHIAGITVASDE
ncbi:MAG TPA: hypothetical protein VGM20_12625 [Gemmatimonadales bacterium]|jgi:hypothetical protein